MSPVRTPLLVNGNMASSINSNGVYLDQLATYAIQAVWTGSPIGSLKLQISCDAVPPLFSPTGSSTVTNAAANVVNWSDYTGSTVAVSGAGNWAWKVDISGEFWVRLVYTESSGSGTLNVNFTGKG